MMVSKDFFSILKIWILEHLNHFPGNHFSENKSNPPRDQLGAPGAVHPRSLTSGPAGQPGPLVRTQRRERNPDDGPPPAMPPGQNQRQQRVRLPLATRSHPSTRPETSHSELATGNGGPAALPQRRRPPRCGSARECAFWRRREPRRR
jgi:hypothetical protein